MRSELGCGQRRQLCDTLDKAHPPRWALEGYIPAAAAGSATGLRASFAGLSVWRSLLIGLLLRLEPFSPAGGGDLERRSKREERAAGSF